MMNSYLSQSQQQHNWQVMQQVYKFYNEQKFTDILFEFPNTNYAFTAHRLILAAASPSLLQLFDQEAPNCSAMTITDVDSDTFEQLVVFCYNGKTDITAGNAERMLRGAVTLRLDGVIVVCVNYLMDHISDFLLRKLISLEADIKCKPLEARIIDYIVGNFKKVTQNNEIFGLNAEQWKTIMKKVDVNVVSQEDLFWAFKRWYEYKPAERQQSLPDVIGTLKLTEFQTEFILGEIKPLPSCERLAMEAVKKRGDSITWLAVQNWGEVWLGYKNILRYNQAKEVWEEATRLEIQRYFFSTVFIENCLVFIGGRDQNGVSKEVLGYNLLAKKWTTLPAMQEHRNAVGVAVLDKYIYAIGGKDKRNDALYNVERYDWSAGKWQYVASLSTVRSVEGATVLNGDIYVLGKKDFERYNSAANRWVSCSPLMNVRVLPAVTAHEGYIYALGGAGNNNYKSAERYNPERNEWTRIADLNVNRRYICAASIGGQLWAFGGVIGAALWTDTVEVYDAVNDKWLIKKELPVTGKYTCISVPAKLVENL